ncbi:MAG: hypothetical protein ACKVT2_14265 [Saprospiraceae bacterium]
MIESYFQAEKQGGFVAMAIGIVACSVGGGVLLSAGAPFYTGLSIPLVAIGFVEIMVGATVARRSDFQAEDLKKLYAESPAEFRKLESHRMEGVMRNFVRIKWIEIAFIVLGLAIILLNKEVNFTKGMGAGLFGQGFVMLIFDFFAEKRGRSYTAFVLNQ